MRRLLSLLNWKTGTVVYLGILLALAVGSATTPERWWWSTANLYAPQCLWALPAPILALRARRTLRWWTLLYLLPIAWVFFVMMDLRLSRPSPPPSGALKVLTHNVSWGHFDPERFEATLADEKPDVVLLQDIDARSRTFGLLRRYFPEEQVKTCGQYLFASRYPITSVEELPLPLESQPDSRELPTYVRFGVQLPSSEIAVYDLHLITPRFSLTDLRRGEANARGGLTINAEDRYLQAARVAERLRKETVPVLVAGDFNAPVASQACRNLLEPGLRDAFTEAGWGYGYTFGHLLRTRLSFLRIDHILASRHWAITECHVGDHAGSDHRPVIATVALQP